MICNKCKKEIDDNSKFCGYCGNTITEKKNINKKTILWILVPVVIIVAIVIALLLINSNKGNTPEEAKDFYSLTELEFLKQVNTSEIFTTLDSGVNDELKGTYAILTTQNSEGTIDIIAISEDNSMLKIAQTEYSDWANGINNLFYSNGKIYYAYADDTIWSIDLTEGNGNYNLKQYDFLEGYIYDNAWFYVIGNKIYYFNQYALRICDLTTEECEFQVVDLRQSSDIEIDGKKINVEFNNVYIEDDKFIYILSEDKNDIYKIDINNPTIDLDLTVASYTKVNEVGKNAKKLSESNKLTLKDIKFDYEYNEAPTFFIEYQNKRYDIEGNNLRPITLLPNNYLMVEYFEDDESYFGEIKYINLKTGLVDENYDFRYNEYYNDSLYFINKS